jgi:hypothetical protein
LALLEASNQLLSRTDDVSTIIATPITTAAAAHAPVVSRRKLIGQRRGCGLGTLAPDERPPGGGNLVMA